MGKYIMAVRKAPKICIVSFCICLLFTANIYSEVNNSRYYSSAQISEKVVSFFYGDYPDSKPIVLDIQAGQFTQMIRQLLKQRLFEDGYAIFEVRPDEYLELKIEHRQSIHHYLERRWLIRRNITSKIHHFSFQLTSYPEGQVQSYNSLSIESKPEVEEGGMQWYDPLFLTAIIGGLAYILYFGS